MGIDWEGILDAEGADMADAYEELVADAGEMMDRWDEKHFEDDAEPETEDENVYIPDFDGTVAAAQNSVNTFTGQLQELLKLTGEMLPQFGAFQKELEKLRDAVVFGADADTAERADNIRCHADTWKNQFFDQLSALFPDLADYRNAKSERPGEADGMPPQGDAGASLPFDIMEDGLPFG